jgi:hypothetical protein
MVCAQAFGRAANLPGFILRNDDLIPPTFRASSNSEFDFDRRFVRDIKMYSFAAV